MIRLISSHLVYQRIFYKGQGKGWITWVHFPPLETLSFEENPLYFAALVKDNAIFNASFQFGTILLRVTLNLQRPIGMYNHPLNSSLFGIKIEQQSFLENRKTVCRIHIALCNVSSMLAHIPQILHHMHWSSFHLGSNYNINNLPSLTIMETCLGRQYLTC